MRDVYPLSAGRVEVEPRRGYLHAAVHGTIPDIEEVRFLGSLMDRIMDRAGVKRVLMDARGLDRPLNEPTCEEVWSWFHGRSYHQMAVVLPADLAALGLARFNMTGVSANLPLRAFGAVMDAHRWLDLRLSGERRLSSMTFQAVRTTTPPPEPEAQPPAEKKPSGRYLSAGVEAPEPLPSSRGTRTDRGTDGDARTDSIARAEGADSSAGRWRRG